MGNNMFETTSLVLVKNVPHKILIMANSGNRSDSPVAAIDFLRQIIYNLPKSARIYEKARAAHRKIAYEEH